MTAQFINLYPAALRRQSPPVSATQLAVACLVLVAALSAWSMLARHRAQDLARQTAELEAQLRTERDQLAALGKELGARKGDPLLAAQLAGAEAMLAARREAIAVLEQGRIGNADGFSDYLRAFSRQALQGLWLTAFEISAGGTEMSIAGRAVDAELLPRYVRRLNAEEVFRGRSFAALSMKGEGGDKADSAPGKDRAAAAPPQYVEFLLATRDAAAGGTEARP
jgi:hypothetical protein